MLKSIVLYGAGGHAKVVLSCLEALEIPVAGVFDDNPDISYFQSLKILGYYSRDIEKKSKIIITVGDNLIRMKLSRKVMHEFANAIHPNVILDNQSTLGEGVMILHNSVIQRGVEIGNHVIINTSASIDHDCKIEDFVHVAPGAVLCGNVTIGQGTLIGAGSVLKPGIKIGQWCVIGIGSVIINDVPDCATVVGNPGRIKIIDDNIRE